MRQDIVNGKLWPDAPIAASSDGSCCHLDCGPAKGDASPFGRASKSNGHLGAALLRRISHATHLVAAKRSPPW